MEKGEIAQNEQFHLFLQCFLHNLYLKNPLIATFHLSSAASLNVGRSQNVAFGNGLSYQQFESRDRAVFSFSDNLQTARSFDPYQSEWTAQLDMGQYCLQM